MKEIIAWKTTDGKVFTDQKEATKHEDGIRKAQAFESLATLFGKHFAASSEEMATFVLENLKGFAMAISPLITKSEPKRRPVNWDQLQREDSDE